MLKQLFKNKLILYAVTTALWANLLFVVFRDITTILKINEYLSRVSNVEFKEIFAVSSLVLLLLLKTYIAYLVLSIFNRLDFMNKPFNESTSHKLKKAVVLSILIFVLQFLIEIINEILQFDMSLISLKAPENNALYPISLLLILFYIYKNGLLIKQENDLTI